MMNNQLNYASGKFSRSRVTWTEHPVGRVQYVTSKFTRQIDRLGCRSHPRAHRNRPHSAGGCSVYIQCSRSPRKDCTDNDANLCRASQQR